MTYKFQFVFHWWKIQKHQSIYSVDVNMKYGLLGMFLLLVNCIVAQNTSIQYLALGDSYTCGQSVSKKESWPHQYIKALEENGVRVARFDMVAKTGWRTDELLHRISEAQLANQYDIITIQIGVNNQFQGKSFSKYKKELQELFDFVKSKMKIRTKVIVVSIPDYGFTPAGQRFNQEKISAELDEYNAFAKQLATKYNYQFVNITPISERGIVEPKLVATDGLHPSVKQYTLWVAEVMKQFETKNPDQIGQDYKQ